MSCPGAPAPSCALVSLAKHAGGGWPNIQGRITRAEGAARARVAPSSRAVRLRACTPAWQAAHLRGSGRHGAGIELGPARLGRGEPGCLGADSGFALWLHRASLGPHPWPWASGKYFQQSNDCRRGAPGLDPYGGASIRGNRKRIISCILGGMHDWLAHSAWHTQTRHFRAHVLHTLVDIAKAAGAAEAGSVSSVAAPGLPPAAY